MRPFIRPPRVLQRSAQPLHTVFRPSGQSRRQFLNFRATADGAPVPPRPLAARPHGNANILFRNRDNSGLRADWIRTPESFHEASEGCRSPCFQPSRHRVPEETGGRTTTTVAAPGRVEARRSKQGECAPRAFPRGLGGQSPNSSARAPLSTPGIAASGCWGCTRCRPSRTSPDRPGTTARPEFRARCASTEHRACRTLEELTRPDAPRGLLLRWHGRGP